MGDNKVMTDGQRETLEMQITLYRYICDMLADTYYSLILQPQMKNPPLPEFKVENTSPPPPPPPQQQESLILNSYRKSGSRKRWTPTPQQLEILNGIFEESSKAPSNKTKIKEITAELSHHGQVTETNVYTWFQNRRARMKRKLEEKNVGRLDDHINQQQQMMIKMEGVDQLASTSTSYKL